MPKLVDYPRRNFNSVEELAKAVESLGGECSDESAAAKMGLNVTGSFRAIISAAIKHGWINSRKGRLETTEEYRNLKLAYTDAERTTMMIEAFLAPGLYSRLYERFKGLELPTAILPKMLIKEFQVDAEIAERVMGYFIEGATQLGLIQNNILVDYRKSDSLTTFDSPKKEESMTQSPISNSPLALPPAVLASHNEFIVQITGPGLNTSLTLSDSDDFDILEVMIRKLRKLADSGKNSVRQNSFVGSDERD
jgi:hypothetical protein